MIVLEGKSGSGKDSIGKELEKLGYIKTVTYTTRPARQNEVDGVDYHFVSTDYFKELVGQEFFAEWRDYETDKGIWLYGSAKKDYNIAANKYIILTPSGLDAIKENSIDTTTFYIDVNDDVILERLHNRGDDPKEVKRRFLADIADFENIENKVDFTISNNGQLSLQEIATMINYATIGKRSR